MPKKLEPGQSYKESIMRTVRLTDDNDKKLMKICSVTQMNRNKVINELISKRFDMLESEPQIKKAMDNIESAMNAVQKAINQLDKKGSK